MTTEEKLTKTVTPQVLEDFYNEKILPYLNGMGVNYSTSEQDTGLKWIDGKKIYQKTISTTMPNSLNTVKTVSIGATIDTVVNYNAFMLMEHTWQKIGAVNAKDSLDGVHTKVYITDNFATIYTKNSICMFLGVDTWKNNNLYVTVWYTKTS